MISHSTEIRCFCPVSRVSTKFTKQTIRRLDRDKSPIKDKGQNGGNKGVQTLNRYDENNAKGGTSHVLTKKQSCGKKPLLYSGQRWATMYTFGLLCMCYGVPHATHLHTKRLRSLQPYHVSIIFGHGVKLELELWLHALLIVKIIPPLNNNFKITVWKCIFNS